MADIFDEIDEELRADKTKAVLRRYGGLIAAGVFAVVLGVGAWQGWHWWQQRQDQGAATRFFAAMQIADTLAPTPGLAPAETAATAEKRGRAIADFAAIAADASPGYRALARLREAGLKADAGDLSGAVAVWDQLAGDASADPLLRDLATLTSATRQIDTADPAALADRLKPMVAEGNPWRALAEEQLALLDIRQGKPDVAKTVLARLARDLAAPAGVRNRSGVLLLRLGETATEPTRG